MRSERRDSDRPGKNGRGCESSAPFGRPHNPCRLLVRGDGARARREKSALTAIKVLSDMSSARREKKKNLNPSSVREGKKKSIIKLSVLAEFPARFVEAIFGPLVSAGEP